MLRVAGSAPRNVVARGFTASGWVWQHPSGGRSSLTSLAPLRRLLDARRGGLRVEGPPSPHPPERPGPDLPDEIPDPPELGLPQPQLVPRREQEQARHPAPPHG